MPSSSFISAAVLLVLLLCGVCTARVQGGLAKQSSTLANISAVYECNANCTEGCVPASIPQGACFYVPPAHSYIIYTCINNNTEVELKVFGPLSFMCSEEDPLHLTFTYQTETCVLPKAGGYTRYHCPPL
jgi:hypothetical protein